MYTTLLSLMMLLNVQYGIGTVFSANDVYNPDPSLACSPGKILKDTDRVIAHRELPCFTKVVICNPRTNKCTNAIVKDRGPFGVTKGKYTSIVDMTPEIARIIKHNGKEKVIIVYNDS